MQTLLSYDQSPPLSVPFRFLLTAPVFALLAGLLLLWQGADLPASRWTPGVLALTHLVTVGFMLQAMLGAMLQILPVVAGANMTNARPVAALAHLSLIFGTLFLTAAFLSFAPYWFIAAAIFLGIGVLAFIIAAMRALFGVPSTSPTIDGLKLALLGLAVTVGLGVLMSIAFGGGLDLPLLQVADIHLGWGFVAWGVVLLAAVALVVVPMFQLTPNYPSWLGGGFLIALTVVVALWSAAEFLAPDTLALLAKAGAAGLVALFAGATLAIQRRSKRPRFDATQHLWRLAMLCALAACALWGGATAFAGIGEWPAWPLLFGALALFGGFVSVITGMLYKIVPFLIWLHLQNLGRGKRMAPNMKKIIDERSINRQVRTHAASCLLLALAVVWPQWLARPAGAALVLAQADLLLNLWSGMRVYRAHRREIEQAA